MHQASCTGSVHLVTLHYFPSKSLLIPRVYMFFWAASEKSSVKLPESLFINKTYDIDQFCCWKTERNALEDCKNHFTGLLLWCFLSLSNDWKLKKTPTNIQPLPASSSNLSQLFLVYFWSAITIHPIENILCLDILALLLLTNWLFLKICLTSWTFLTLWDKFQPGCVCMAAVKVREDEATKITGFGPGASHAHLWEAYAASLVSA